jgi:hypothetical protein
VFTARYGLICYINQITFCSLWFEGKCYSVIIFVIKCSQIVSHIYDYINLRVEKRMQHKVSKEAEIERMRELHNSFKNIRNCVSRNSNIFPLYINFCSTETRTTWPPFFERINVS